MLTGEIQIGETFIWEPNEAQSYERIQVTAIRINGGATEIQTRGAKGEWWCSETRFREACIRQKVTPGAPTKHHHGVQIR